MIYFITLRELVHFKLFKSKILLFFDSTDHTFTPKQIWVWVLGMGVIPTPKTHNQNPNNLGMKPETQTQNQTILGMKPKTKPKPKFFFHYFSFFELINVFSFKIFNFEMNS